MSLEGKSLPPIASTTQTKPWSNVLDHVGCISLLNSNISWLSAHSLVVKLNSGWLNTSERIAGAFGRASPQEASHGMELCKKKLAKWRLHREKIRLQGVQCGASIMSNVGKTIMNHPCGNGSYLSTLTGDGLWHWFAHINRFWPIPICGEAAADASPATCGDKLRCIGWLDDLISPVLCVFCDVYYMPLVDINDVVLAPKWVIYWFLHLQVIGLDTC